MKEIDNLSASIEILIESQWNLNDNNYIVHVAYIIILIESQWNLNFQN